MLRKRRLNFNHIDLALQDRRLTDTHTVKRYANDSNLYKDR